MKKYVRIICVILICSILFAIPAQADTVVEPRESYFFGSYVTYLYRTSSTSLQIWIEVDSNVATMDVLGVSEIVLYRSVNMNSWTKVRVYTMENYPQLVDTNTRTHVGHVTYNNASPGFYYRAYVTFYAKNSTGTGERYVYTDILRM